MRSKPRTRSIALRLFAALLFAAVARAGPPTMTVRVAGTCPIRRVEIKKNANAVDVREPNRSTVEFTWRDPAFQADLPAYYYVRVVQENGEEAISSPLWVN